MTAPAAPTLTFDVTDGDAPVTVSVTVDASDADTANVEWGDGATGSAAPGVLTHTYLTPGQWIVLISVENVDGRTDADPQTITVWEPSGDLRDGPCNPWITEADLPCDPTPHAQEAIDAATRWFYDVTCQAWGDGCLALLRPYTGGDDCGGRRERLGRKLDMSRWLPAPILQVFEVRIAGVLVPREWWRLSNHRYLVALDGFGVATTPNPLFPWPEQMSRQLGAPGTWSILVEFGRPVPLPLTLVVAQFACEIMKQLDGDDSCKLPDNTVSVTRDGVTVQLKIAANGRTGVPFIDSALDLYGCGQGIPARRIHDPAAPRADVAYLTA